MDLINKPHSGMFPVHPGRNRDLLNVAATCIATRCLGPGLRAAVWVQGCLLRCPGCIAPGWLPDHINRLVVPERLAVELLSDPRTTGITISGGEPFLQPAALASMIRQAKRMREIDVICFTGYRLADLVELPPAKEAFDLLDLLDILIDGPYIQEQNHGIGLRGSDNQVVHRLSGKLASFDFENCPRQVEMILGENELQVIGVPPKSFLEAVDQSLDKLQHIEPEKYDERS